MSNYRRSTIEAKISPDESRDIPDSPELRAFLRSMELGCQVLEMRKRSFLFFKRKLRPQEKQIELMKLQMREQVSG